MVDAYSYGHQGLTPESRVDPESRIHDAHHDALAVLLLFTCTHVVERAIPLDCDAISHDFPAIDLMAQLERNPGLK